VETCKSVGHRLQLNHSNALPRHIIAYDTETIPDTTVGNGTRLTHRFRLGVAISCRVRGNELCDTQVHRLERPAAFWQLVYTLTGPRHTTWIVSHNALFDLVVSGFAHEFDEARLVIDWPRSKRKREDNLDDNVHAKTLCVIDSPPTIIACKCASTQGRLVALDTLNYFAAPLSVLGDACGLPKLSMPSFSADDETWFRYCERDAEIVFKTFTQLMQWVRDNDMGMFRYTGPSQAMSAYRHRFMINNVHVHTETDVKTLERRSYFGGRTEMFRKGKISHTVHQYDVNALFPSVMRVNKFPCMLHAFERDTRLAESLPSIDYAASVADVVLKTTADIFPRRLDGRITYPVGTFRTVLCGEELQHAYSHGLIKLIGAWSEYRTVDLFSLWVDSLWGMRQRYKMDGNELYRQFTKTLMNSLYGKFGQLSPKWINVENMIDALPWSRWPCANCITGERVIYRSFGWQVQRRSEREEIDGTFVAISSFVTSAARMRMNRLRDIAGRRNVYYQGVDGLIVNDVGSSLLHAANEIDNEAIGKLRHQVSADYGEIYGCSDYRLGDKTVVSGRAKLFQEIESGEVLQRKFAVESQLFSGKALDTVEEQIHTWQRSGNYSKGVIGDDGWVSPHFIATEG